MNDPVEGDVVRVRGLAWVVTDTRATGGTHQETMVDLMSVADGHYGKSLRVVWELEPDRRVLDSTPLPDPDGEFDHPDELAAFLDAIRWSAVTSADTGMLQAPFRSGVRIEPYQLEPVARALKSARVNLLLADDVGLGKTIEAGLVALELLLRHRAETVMVVAPAGLTLKWREDMAEKFGLDFTIVDAALLKELRRTHGLAANPFQVYRHTIVSLSWLRGARAERLLNDGMDRPLDLLIVDEAHHVAPAVVQRGRAVHSQQSKAVRELATRFRHRLFLSATPHNGYTQSFTALLEMLDPHRFVYDVPPDRDVRDEVMIRRLKGSIRHVDGTPRFPGREPRAIEVHYSADELLAYEWLTEFVALRRRAGAGRRRLDRPVDLVALILKKRLFSSPAAFADTVRMHLGSFDRRSGLHDGDGFWLEDDDDAEDAENLSLVRLGRTQPDLTPEERALLVRMRDWSARRATSPDAKAKALLAYLKKTCRPEGRWTQERVVVFTEYRATLTWLLDQLRQEGMVSDGRAAVLDGDTPLIQREQLRDAFQARPGQSPLRILLATDVAGEGVDLQRHCHRLVNYDIPFNPNRLEQRIGRIDRYGQSSVAEIFHFVGAGWEHSPAGSYTRDLEFLSRVAVKVARISRDLGEVNQVMAKNVEDHMLGRPVEPAFEADAVAVDEPEQKAVSAHVEQLTAQLGRSMTELRITPSNVRRVVTTALRQARQQPLIEAGGECFQVPVLAGDWARAAASLWDRVTGTQRLLTFDAAIAEDRDDLVFAHLGHPLVAMSIELLRAGMWGARSLRRVTAVISGDNSMSAPTLIAYNRLVLVGHDGVRLHEEIFHAAISLADGWPAVTVPADPLAHAESPRPIPEGVRVRLRRAWPRALDALLARVSVCAHTHKNVLLDALRTRREEEIQQVNTTLDRLGKDLQQALANLDDGEGIREAHRLRHRLRAADTDRQSEIDAIDRRYRVVRHHVFPAALVFVVPEWEASR